MESFNWLVIAGATLAAWILGALWYSPLLFAKVWVAAHGYSPEKLKEMQAGAAKSYGGSLIAMFITATVLTLFLHHLSADSWQDGFNWGFHAWLGFAMPLGLTANLYSDKKFSTFLIDTGYQLVYLCVMGAILGKFGA
ncbi:MAG: DUF1761 domain-containing protein [Gemmatimonadota bacterium]